MSVLPVPTIDHVVVNAREDLDGAAEYWRRLGFALTPRGYHTLGSMNHLAMFGTDYLELIGVPPGGKARVRLLDWPAGLNAIVFASEDAAQTFAALREAAVPAMEPLDFARPVDLPDGTVDAVFRTVNLPDHAFAAGRLYFCQHKTRHVVWRDEWRRHDNAVVGVDSMAIVAREPEEPATLFRAMFGADAVEAINGGYRLHAGLTAVDCVSRQELERRFEDAAPPEDDRRSSIAAIVFRTASLVRAGLALRQGNIGARDIVHGIVVPAAETGGTTIAFRS